jgi:hypothetical protein
MLVIIVMMAAMSRINKVLDNNKTYRTAPSLTKTKNKGEEWKNTYLRKSSKLVS